MTPTPPSAELIRWCVRIAVLGSVVFLLKQAAFLALIAGEADPRERTIYIGYVAVAAAGAAFELLCAGWLRRRGSSPAFATAFLLGNSVFLTACYACVILVYGDFFTLLLLPAYFLIGTFAGLLLDGRATIAVGVAVAAEYVLLVGVATRMGLLSSIEPGFLAGATGLLVANGLLVSHLARARAATEVANAELRAEAERRRIVEIFGQQVSPKVVERLLAQKTLPSSERRHVCVMFLDIRGFTSFSEGRTPEEVIAYLNGLWEILVDVVNEHHGIVNKFLGDGFMATFGAPFEEGNSSRNALDAAVAIVAAVERAVAEKRCPPTRIGIGLHAGEVVAGNVGSASRKEYTVLGDVVNLASRIESLNKEFESTLLASKAVVDASAQPVPGTASLGAVQIRGHHAPVEILKIR